MSRKAAQTIPMHAEQLSAFATQFEALAKQLRDTVEEIGESGSIDLVDEGLPALVSDGCTDFSKAVASANDRRKSSSDDIYFRTKQRRVRKNRR